MNPVKSTLKFPALIKFPSSDTKNGVLTMFEYGKKIGQVPFPVKRTLVIRGMKASDRRGGHTHHKTSQILVCLSGSCTVRLDDGSRKTSVKLNRPDLGLWLAPYVWHTMSGFSDDCVLLVLADSTYNEKDYIREYGEFKKCLKK